MLEIQSIHQHYGSSHTLRSLSLTAAIGQTTCVLGRNGVGKSTLLRCLMGLQKLSEGKILWNGEDISALSPEDRVRRGLGYVPQGREIFARLTVEENLFMGMAALPSREAKRISSEIYDLFPVLAQMRSRRGGDLSGGQQQQLAIGRALVGKPKLLLLDEPTEGIQPNIIKHIGKVIESLRARGDMAIVLVEQYYDFAQELASRYAVLSRGEVVDSGEGSEMVAKNVKSLLAV
jgi:urea transport system ATP-binding protein